MFDYINEAKTKLWDAFSKSSVDILKELQVGTTSQIQGGGGAAQLGQLFTRSGGLVKDIQSPDNIEHKIDDNFVSRTKKLSVPHGYLVSQDDVAVTDPMRKKFWAMYFNTSGAEKKMWRSMALFAKTIHGRGFVHNSIENINIEPIIKKHIKAVFPDKRKELIIGG